MLLKARYSLPAVKGSFLQQLLSAQCRQLRFVYVCVCGRMFLPHSVLNITLDEVVTPGLVMKVAGEGLPLPTPGGQLKVRHHWLHQWCIGHLVAVIAQSVLHTLVSLLPQGDLYIEFELLFPKRLTQQQKMLLAAGLYLPAKPSTAASKALRDFEAAYRDAKQGWSSGVLRDDAAAADGQQQ